MARKSESRIRAVFLRGALLFLLGLVLILLAKYVMAETVFQTGVKEVGFALLISVIVWGLFENQISNNAEAVWDLRIERLTDSVFQAVLRKDLPKGLLDEANNLVLNNSAIRENFQVTYTLDDLSITSSDPCFSAVRVQAIMEFRMKNVGTDVFKWDVNLALPNPVHTALKQLVEVNRVTVTKGGEPITLDLEAAQTKFLKGVAESNGTHILYHAGTVDLNPGESCEFEATYQMIKESEDSEYLQTIYPCDGLRVTIVDVAPESSRTVFADAVHRHELQETESSSEPKARIFKIPGYLLPHQGVLIWWKKAQNGENMPLQINNPSANAPATAKGKEDA